MRLASIKAVTASGLLMASITAAAVGYAQPGAGPKPSAVPAAAARTKPQSEPPGGRAYEGKAPALARWHTYDLRVVDDANGAPLGPCQAIVVEYVSMRPHTFSTDAVGRLRVEYPEIGGMRAVIEVRKEGFVPQYLGISRPAGPLDATFTARLRPAKTIGGTIVDEAGKPIKGATVVVTARLPQEQREQAKVGEGHENTTEVPCTTDAQGRWRCPYVSPDAVTFKLQLIHPDYVSGTSMVLNGPELRTPDVDELLALKDRQVMKKGVRLVGRVIDVEKRPIAGAEIMDTTRGFTSLPFLRHAMTDKEGRFHFHFDPNETVTMVVRAKGYMQLAWGWKPDSGSGPVDFEMRPARPLRARVIDRQGKPCPGVLVSIRSPQGTGWVSPRLWTDAEGRFSWDEAPDVAVPLSFSKGVAPGTVHPIRPSEKETEVVLGD